ncbi:MAG: hypothetical protein JNK60_17065 [Acidobacteria bacterium]|nr:hypothetical protein [Acidobacteriota bacterium]
MIRFIACLILVLGAASSAPADSVLEAMARKDWPALERLLAEKRAQAPRHPVYAYDHACVLTRLGRKEEALGALKTAVANGFPYLALFRRDEDLDPLRELPGFAEIEPGIRANNAVALAAFQKKHAEGPKVLFFAPPEARAEGEVKPLPVVVALHPSGGSAETFAPVFRDMAREIGALLVVPEGVTPEGDGYNWGVSEQGGWLVTRAIEKARARYSIDEKRIVLAGWSNGANQGLLLGLERPELAMGIVAAAGYFEDRLFDAAPGKKLPRVAFVNGERDSAAVNNRRGAEILKKAGAAVHLKILPNHGHGLPPAAELRDALRFAFALD